MALGLLFGLVVAGTPSPADESIRPLEISHSAAGFDFELTTPPVETVQGPDGTVLSVTGFGSRSALPGAPDLPFKTVMVAIPPGTTPRLEYSVGSTDFRPDWRPRPFPTTALASGDAATASRPERPELSSLVRREIFEEDPALYAAPSTRPWVRLGPVEQFRHQRYVKVELHPLRWDSERAGVIVAESLRVWLTFEGDDGRRVRAPEDPQFERIYRRMFANYGQGRMFRTTPDPLRSGTFEKSSEAGTDGDSPRRRIRIRQNGPVRLGSADLAGTGFESQLLSSYRLESQGSEVPLQIFVVSADTIPVRRGIGHDSNSQFVCLELGLKRLRIVRHGPDIGKARF